MNASKKQDNLQELNHFIHIIEPELHAFQSMVKHLSDIESPYKQQFTHINVKFKFEAKDLKHTGDTISHEFSTFKELLDKINKDKTYKNMYLQNGILDFCKEIITNLDSKLASIHH